jgi:hypothetical protein
MNAVGPYTSSTPVRLASDLGDAHGAGTRGFAIERSPEGSWDVGVIATDRAGCLSDRSTWSRRRLAGGDHVKLRRTSPRSSRSGRYIVVGNRPGNC